MTDTTRPKTHFPVSFCLLGSVKSLLGFEIPCVRVCHQSSSSWISSQGDDAFLLWFCLRIKFGRVSPAHGKLGGYGFCCCNKCNACDPFLFDLLCRGVHGLGRQGSTSCEHSHLLPIANRCCVMSSSHPLCWSMAFLCRWTLDSKFLLVSNLHELFPQPTSAYFSWENGSTQL